MRLHLNFDNSSRLNHHKLAAQSTRYVDRSDYDRRDALQVAKAQHSCLTYAWSAVILLRRRMVELKNPLWAAAMVTRRALFALRKGSWKANGSLAEQIPHAAHLAA